MHSITNQALSRCWRLGRRVAGALIVAGLSGPLAAQTGARLPQRNLLVEVRQVDEGSASAQGGGVERGAVIVSSDGRVSGGAEVGWQASTRQRGGSIAQQLRVLNGGRASMRLGQSVPLQWWQISSLPAGASGSSGARQGAQVVPSMVFTEAGRGFSVRPRWPGGDAPVTVEIETELVQARDPNVTVGGEANDGATSDNFKTLTTLRFPLGEWVTVASSGTSSAGAERGVVSTRDVSRSRQIVVQMRVTAQ
jgi:hypothetical protein